MNGKGSARRPMQISADEFARNWERAFKAKKPNAKMAARGYGGSKSPQRATARPTVPSSIFF